MDWINIVGYLGTFLSSITFIPQVWQAWKTKSVGDLSFWMIILLIGNVSTWLVYGILMGASPIIVANTIILVLVLLLFYFKLIFPKPKS